MLDYKCSAEDGQQCKLIATAILIVSVIVFVASIIAMVSPC